MKPNASVTNPQAVGIYGNRGKTLLGIPQSGNETPASANSGSVIQGITGDDTHQILQYTSLSNDFLERLANRLAPSQLLFQAVNFINSTGGGLVQGTKLTQPLQAPFNKIINNLTRGTVNVYFGTIGNMYQFQLGPVANPTPTYFPPQYFQNVIFQVDPNSSTDAFGVVYLVNL